MRRHLPFLALLTVAAGCAAVSQPEPRVRFEIRGLTTKQDETEFNTTYMHTATLVVLGDSVAAKAPYLVMIDLERLSGGDPEIPRQRRETIWAETVEGTGDVRIFAGVKGKATAYHPADSWEAERVRLRVLGFVPVTELKDAQPVEN